MYYLLQLLIAVSTVYGALRLEGDRRLYAALVCLIIMFIVGRLDKERFEKKQARRSFLKSEMERMAQQDPNVIKEQDLMTVNSLLSPKGELFLIDAVHFIFRDLGFRVATGGRYTSIDRTVRIPGSVICFGVEILMSDEAVEKNHPKIERVLHFEKEREEHEKTLIIASTHVHRPISERNQLNEISIGLHEFLRGCQITLLTAHVLYQLWQKSKAGEIEIFDVFRNLYSHPGGIFIPPDSLLSSSVSLHG